MKRNILFCTISVVLLCVLTGCGKKKDAVTATATATDAQETTEAVTEATLTDAVEEEKLKTIGEEAENGYSVILTNLTGQDIVSVRVYDSVSDEYSDNLLLEEDAYASMEQRILFYDDKTEENYDGADDEKLISVGYDIEITLADDSVYVLHGFPFGTIEEGSIYVEDDVAFVEYDDYSTKDAELAIKEAENAANNVVQPKQNTTQQQISEPTEPSAPAPVESSPSAPEEPAPTEPAVEPAPAEPSVDQDVEDCIGDEGLTY